MASELLTSPKNPWIRKLRQLHRSKGRREQGAFLVEGSHLIEEALRVGWPLQALCYTLEWAERYPQLLANLPKSLRRQAVSSEVMAALCTTESPEGAVAVAVSRQISSPPPVRGTFGPCGGNAARSRQFGIPNPSRGRRRSRRPLAKCRQRRSRKPQSLAGLCRPVVSPSAPSRARPSRLDPELPLPRDPSFGRYPLPHGKLLLGSRSHLPNPFSPGQRRGWPEGSDYPTGRCPGADPDGRGCRISERRYDGGVVALRGPAPAAISLRKRSLNS